MSSPFTLATTLQATGPGSFLAHIPEGWQQGRGAFGGLVLALLTRALEQTDADPSRRVRVLSGEICGPVQAGEARLEARALRRGKHLSNLDAQLLQHGEVQARASAIISTARPAQATLPAPEAPAGLARGWRSLDPIDMGPPLAPAFSQHYAYRLAGFWPFSGGKEARAEGWISEREAPAVLDAPTMIGRLDAWWPAILATFDGPRATATISFMAELLADPATLSPEPFFYRGHVVAIEEGFFVELRELWQDGRLVALNQQTFALLS
jgi:hypothetical protein